MLKTKNHRTLIILRENSSASKRVLYAQPFPIPEPTRYATREELKKARQENLWKERQIVVTIKLEDHLRYTFPSTFTHIPLSFAAMLNPVENSLSKLKLKLNNKHYESLSVAAALHRAFLRFVAKKIILRIKKPTLENRNTYLTKGLDLGGEEEDQAEEVVVNYWGWEYAVDTAMKGIKTKYAPRSWQEESFDGNWGSRRYQVFRISNLRYCWSYEEEVADENVDVVEETAEEVVEEGITHWEIEDPWWEEEGARRESTQWGNV